VVCVFARLYVAHAGRLRRPLVALGDAIVFFVSFVPFVCFVASRRRCGAIARR